MKARIAIIKEYLERFKSASVCCFISSSVCRSVACFLYQLVCAAFTPAGVSSYGSPSPYFECSKNPSSNNCFLKNSMRQGSIVGSCDLTIKSNFIFLCLGSFSCLSFQPHKYTWSIASSSSLFVMSSAQKFDTAMQLINCSSSWSLHCRHKLAINNWINAMRLFFQKHKQNGKDS